MSHVSRMESEFTDLIGMRVTFVLIKEDWLRFIFEEESSLGGGIIGSKNKSSTRTRTRRKLHRNHRRTQYTNKNKRSSKSTKYNTIKHRKSYRKHNRTIKRRKNSRHRK